MFHLALPLKSYLPPHHLILVHISNYFSECRMQSRSQVSDDTSLKPQQKIGYVLDIVLFFLNRPIWFCCSLGNLVIIVYLKVFCFFSPNHFWLLTTNVLPIILFKSSENIIPLRILSSNLSLPNPTPRLSCTLTWTIMPYSFYLLNSRNWWLGWWCHHFWESVQL